MHTLANVVVSSLLSAASSTPAAVPLGAETSSQPIATRAAGAALAVGGALGITTVAVAGLALVTPLSSPRAHPLAGIVPQDQRHLMTALALPVLLGVGVAAASAVGAGALMGSGLVKLGGNPPVERAVTARSGASTPRGEAAQNTKVARRGQAEQRLGM